MHLALGNEPPNANYNKFSEEDGDGSEELDDYRLVPVSPIPGCYNFAAEGHSVKIIWPSIDLQWVTIFAHRDCSAAGNITLNRHNNMVSETAQCLSVGTGHLPSNITGEEWVGEINYIDSPGSVLLGSGVQPTNLPPNYSPGA